MEMFADGECFPTDCPFRIRHPVTHGPTLFVFFFPVYLFVLFLRGASSLSHRSDPTCRFSFSFCCPCLYLLPLHCPSHPPIHIPVTHYTSPRPPSHPPLDPHPYLSYHLPQLGTHSLLDSVTLSNTMTKGTHARGHIYSLAEVAKRESLLSFTHYCRLTPVQTTLASQRSALTMAKSTT